MRRLAMLLALALAAACSRPEAAGSGPAPAPPAHDDEASHTGLPRKVHLSKEVIADARIRTEPATREGLGRALGLAGEIAADPDKSARIAAPVSGRIEKVAFKEGDAVKKNQLLVVVRVPELGRLRAEAASAKAKARAARANGKRMQQLFDKRLASEQDLLDAQASADALEIQARGLSEQIGALGGGGATRVVLRSPVAGVVVSRNAIVGQPLGPETTIASITDLSEVWFLGRVFEKDLGSLHQGASAEVTLNAYPDARFEGSVEYIGKQIDPVARTLTARIRLENRDELLRLGLFGTARVATGKARGTPTLVVPRSAITEIGGKTVVFVQHPDGDFETHDVVTGDAGLGKVAILSGLREGEAVVVEGAFSVKAALLRSTFTEEGE